MAIEGLLAILLAFMPLAFGAVEAWSELAVVAVAAVMSLAVVLRTAVDRTFRPAWTWAYVPLALFVLLVIFQLTPLPQGLAATLSPGAASVRRELLGAAADEQPATISLYPPATAHGLRLVLVGAAVFFVTASVIRTAPQVKRLLLIVFVIGCAEALLAVLQIFTRTNRMYWLADFNLPRLTSGSFVNYSNFCQFMNMSIGAGLGLLLVRLQSERRHSRGSGGALHSFGGVRLSDHATLLAGLTLCSIAVLMSLSRNGAISLVAAAIVVGTALYRSGTLSRRGWVLGMVPLALLAALVLFGFDAMFERLALLHREDAFSDRWELTLGALRAWREFPVWGAGLGTHEFVFPMFDPSTSAQLAAHADNDYAQLLEETGLAGAILAAAFLAVIGGLIVKVCRRGRNSLSAAAYGLALGLIAVAIHSASDFGQRLPAVFCLSAIACGLAVQLERHYRQSKKKNHQPALERDRPLLRRGVALAALVALGGCWAWALQAAYTAHVGEQWWYAAYQLDEDIQRAGAAATDEEYADLLAAAEQAAATQPQNVTYGYWLNVFRWRVMSRNVDPATGAVLLTADAPPLVERIADELAGVRRLCPTYGPPYALEGQLRLFVLGDNRGAELIRQGVNLAPYDPPTCLIAGEVAGRDGRLEEAQTLLDRAVALAPHLFRDVAAIFLFDMNRPDMARKLAGDDYARLAQLAELAATSHDHQVLADEFRRAAESALRRRAATDDVTAAELALLASYELRDGDRAAAIPLYGRALGLDYNKIEWRLALAQALADSGEYDKALHQADICLRLRPGNEAVKQLIADLSVRSSQEFHRGEARAP
jgi:O-antigen ligase